MVRKTAILAPPFSEQSFASIARATGKSRSYITKIMNGSRTPSLDVFAAIAEARRMTLDDLYDELISIRALMNGDAVVVNIADVRAEAADAA